MIYFIGDSHLGARYVADRKAHEARLCRWLDMIAPDCEQLYLLGDIIDYWFEYKTVVPRGYVRFFGRLASMVDRGVKVVWLKGNHDMWISDYLPGEIGVEIVDGVYDTVIKGKRFVMEHGDGVGRLPRVYSLMRRMFRNRFLRRLYATVHPRLTMGFAHAWSGHSRKAGGYAHVDPTPLVEWADEYVSRVGKVDYFVLGHLHTPFQKKLASGAELVIVGDCINRLSYAAFNGSSLTLYSGEE